MEVNKEIIYIYIYIYMYTFIKKKQQTGHIRIMNLFPSCYMFLKNPRTRKKLTGLLQIDRFVVFS